MMKKILLLVLVGIFTCVMAGVAIAGAGPHKGGTPGFTQDTDACAGCHRAHTGVHASLLKAGNTYYEFCVSCHDGTGANTNVVDGVFTGTTTSWGTQTYGTAGNGLNGGGFSNAKPYTDRSGRNGTSAAVTSKHDVASDSATYTAWGGGNSGPGYTMTLTCVSCHDPHGTTNYRILKADPKSNGYTPGPVTSNESTPDFTSIKYKSGQSAWCVDCHSQYMTAQGTRPDNDPVSGTQNTSGTYDAGDGLGAAVRYRHPVDVSLGGTKAGNLNSHIKLPVDQGTYSSSIQSGDEIQCLSCHQVHGTIATMTINAQVGPAADTALLRLNNRGVCENCHQK
jgi:predicted CXXCH cytochrome family protein